VRSRQSLVLETARQVQAFLDDNVCTNDMKSIAKVAKQQLRDVPKLASSSLHTARGTNNTPYRCCPPNDRGT
jgi:hypothetical protein